MRGDRTVHDVPEIRANLVGAAFFGRVAGLAFLEHLFARADVRAGEERAERVLAVVADVNKSVQRYVSLKVLISFITAFVSVVIMKVSGLHYAATFGIIVFLFNFVPYIGSVIATILPCLVGLLQFKEPLSALWLAIALAVAQQIIGNVIEPRVQGKGLSISPVVIILALGFWGWLWGISGMILAVPITVTIRIILEQFETTRRPALMMGSDG